jgi:membrane peptidoglycan carboxypeptidase
VQARLRGAGEDGIGYGAADRATGGNGALDGSRRAGGRGVAGSADDRFWAEAGGSRGSRTAGHAGGSGGGYYGPGDYGPGRYDGRRAAGRTATRAPGDFWDDPDRTSRGTRTRTAERQLTHGGGNGRGGGSRGGGHGGGRYGGGPRNRAGGFKNWLLYGSWWRHWTLKKALAVVGAGIAACFLLGIGVFFLLYEMTPVPTAKELTANWQSSTVYLANGHQMGLFDGGGVDRILLNSQQIPRQMTQAMVAAEDRHFYTEGGVSLTGLLRAAYEDIRGNGTPQGASTITMQYAKNYYAGVNTGQNLSTELKEIFIAMKLGHDQTKTSIMTNYLNTVPFGATIDGLGAAAESYFNVNLTQPNAKLTLAQAAMLAAMPNNPAVFSSGLQGSDPLGLSLLKTRFEYVLGGMVKDGNISEATAAATKFPAITPPPSGNGENGYTGYLMNMVLQQLEAPKADGGYGLTQQQVDTGGYKITTTFSMAKVNALARAVNEEKGQIQQQAALSGGLYVKFQNYDRIGAVLENSKSGAIVAVYGGPGFGSKRCNLTSCDINMAEEAEPVGSSFKPYVLSEAVRLGMNVVTSKLNGFSPIWIPLSTPQGATATQLLNSPYILPPGCTAPTPTQVGGNCASTNGNEYFLFNELSEDSHKPLAVNEAAAISSDPAFEDLAHRDGVDNVIDMAKAFGVGQTAFVDPCSVPNGGSVADTIKACNDLTGPDNGLIPTFSTQSKKPTAGSPAVALGENPLTPVEQASTFATLADDGVYHTPHVIQSLQQNNGTVVPSNLKSRRVLSAPQVADVDWALSFDNTYNVGGEQGTALATVPFAQGDLIAKTGTLGTGANASEAWFNASTRKLFSMSVALFTNLPGKQNLDNLPKANGTPGSQGGGWPASIFNAYMQRNVNPAQVLQLLPTVQTNFQTWIQVKAQAPKKQICKQGGGGPFGGFGGGKQQNCICPPHATFCGNNPNPGASCHGNGNGNGNNCNSPAPTSSCQGAAAFGGQCSSSPPPSDSPSPTTTPSITPSVGAQTTSFLRSSPVSAGILTVAGDKQSTRLAALLGLII